MRYAQELLALVEAQLRAGKNVILFARPSIFEPPETSNDKVWPELNYPTFRVAVQLLLDHAGLTGSYELSKPDDLDGWTFYAYPKKP